MIVLSLSRAPAPTQRPAHLGCPRRHSADQHDLTVKGDGKARIIVAHAHRLRPDLVEAIAAQPITHEGRVEQRPVIDGLDDPVAFVVGVVEEASRAEAHDETVTHAHLAEDSVHVQQVGVHERVPVGARATPHEVRPRGGERAHRHAGRSARVVERENHGARLGEQVARELEYAALVNRPAQQRQVVSARKPVDALRIGVTGYAAVVPRHHDTRLEHLDHRQRHVEAEARGADGIGRICRRRDALDLAVAHIAHRPDHGAGAVCVADA